MLDLQATIATNKPEQMIFSIEEVRKALKESKLSVVFGVSQEYPNIGKGDQTTIFQLTGESKTIETVSGPFWNKNVSKQEIHLYISLTIDGEVIMIDYSSKVDWSNWEIIYTPYISNARGYDDLLARDIPIEMGITTKVVKLPPQTNQQKVAVKYAEDANNTANLANYWGFEEAGFAYKAMSELEATIAQLVSQLDEQGIELPEWFVNPYIETLGEVHIVQFFGGYKVSTNWNYKGEDGELRGIKEIQVQHQDEAIEIAADLNELIQEYKKGSIVAKGEVHANSKISAIFSTVQLKR